MVLHTLETPNPKKAFRSRAALSDQSSLFEDEARCLVLCCSFVRQKTAQGGGGLESELLAKGVGEHGSARVVPASPQTGTARLPSGHFGHHVGLAYGLTRQGLPQAQRNAPTSHTASQRKRENLAAPVQRNCALLQATCSATTYDYLVLQQ